MLTRAEEGGKLDGNIGEAACPSHKKNKLRPKSITRANRAALFASAFSWPPCLPDRFKTRLSFRFAPIASTRSLFSVSSIIDLLPRSLLQIEAQAITTNFYNARPDLESQCHFIDASLRVNVDCQLPFNSGKNVYHLIEDL